VFTTAASPDRILFPRNKFIVALLIGYVIIFILSGIEPHNQFDWLLENLLSILALIILTVSYRNFQFSDLSYLLIFLFMAMHTLGSHYTYSLVPVGAWMQEAFEFDRNHYDRVVHLAFGLLLAYPIREFIRNQLFVSGIVSSVFSIAILVSSSASYEVIEWIVAQIVAPEAGIAYMGTQGDVFDAQKDMALAGLGVISAIFVTELQEYYRR